MDENIVESGYNGPTEDENKTRRYRAIGILADNILERLPYAAEKDENGNALEFWEMSVDQVAKSLDARVGSVYVVFHVFESLLLATKIGPKTYRWNGFAKIKPTLSFLQYIGMYCLNLPKEMEKVQDIEIDALLAPRPSNSSEKDARKVESKSMPSLWPGIEDLIGEGNDFNIMSKSSTVNASIEELNSTDPEVQKNTKKRKGKNRKSEGNKNMGYDDKTPHILQVIQKFIMLFLVPSRIFHDNRKKVSLSFAAKVIHGVETVPEDILLIRTRRLYDVSNILLSISHRCDQIAKEMPMLGFNSGDDIFAMKKVRQVNGSSVRKTTIQYEGPEVEPCRIEDIISLPDYRRDYLYFSQGKSLLGLPERPLRIPRTTTVRLSPNEGKDPTLIPSEGIHLSRLAVMDNKTPISLNDIVYLEATRRDISLNIEHHELVGNEVAAIDPSDLWLAILPGQSTIEDGFKTVNVTPPEATGGMV